MKKISKALLVVIISLCAIFTILFFVPNTATRVQAEGVQYEETQTTEKTLEEQQTSNTNTGAKAIAAAIAISIAAAGGGIGMGIAIAKAVDGISRQPEASGEIRTNMMLGMVFIETVVIYALIVAILIVFVL